MIGITKGFRANLVETRSLIFGIHGFFQIKQSLLRFIDCGVIYSSGSCCFGYLDAFGVSGAVRDILNLAATIAP